MALALRLQHLENYARLRPALASDIAALSALHQSSSPRHAMSESFWERTINSRAAWVCVAAEGGVIVGAAIVFHRPNAAAAKLYWLGVAPSARARGIGRLLLDAATTRAQAEGAAVLCVRTQLDNLPLNNMLVEAGFRAGTNDRTGVSEFRKSLWNSRHNSARNGSDLAFYRQTPGASSAVCSLMMGMARADNGIIMTPRVESVLHHELQADTVVHACPEQAGLALAAVRRGFHAIVHSAPADHLAEQMSNSALQREIDRGSIAVADALPTPEQLVGYLSRGYVPMLRCSFRRLHHDAGSDWRLVTDFDGFLFRVVDPEMPPESEATATAVTTSEMRASLRDERAVALILLKPASAPPTRI